MGPLMERYHGLWLGWPGDAMPQDPDGRAALMREWEERHGYVAVELPAQVSSAFYEGFANDTLWPLRSIDPLWWKLCSKGRLRSSIV